MFYDSQDTLNDVLSHGPALKTFEYRTKNIYYSAGLDTKGSQKHQPKGIFAGNMLSFLEDTSIDEFLAAQNGSPASISLVPGGGCGNPCGQDGRHIGTPNSSGVFPSDGSTSSISDDSDIFNYQMVDLSEITGGSFREMKEINLLDIIEADIDEEILANDIDMGNKWTVPNTVIDSGEFVVENSARDLSLCDPEKNEYFRNDKDTDKEEGSPRNQKGKSSMVRNSTKVT